MFIFQVAKMFVYEYSTISCPPKYNQHVSKKTRQLVMHSQLLMHLVDCVQLIVYFSVHNVTVMQGHGITPKYQMIMIPSLRTTIGYCYFLAFSLATLYPSSVQCFMSSHFVSIPTWLPCLFSFYSAKFSCYATKHWTVNQVSHIDGISLFSVIKKIKCQFSSDILRNMR